MNAFRTLLIMLALSGSATAASYTVRVGDTLSSVAQRYNLQPQKLMQLNGLNSTTLQIGQHLSVGGSTSPARATAAAPQSTQASGGNTTVRAAALRFLGIRYASGGSSNWGLDCSGYTQAVYRSMGVSLPRTAAAQSRSGYAVSRGSLQAGDLMFFSTMGGGISHVAIYLGSGSFANANSYYGRTMVDNLSNPYWSSRYVSARRIL